MRVLYIIRGLPGSGKSTLACKLVRESMNFEADQFFVVNGHYCFDANDLSKAHAWCRMRVAEAMGSGEDVAVSNTATCRWEYQTYLDMAAEAGYRVQVIDLHGPWDNMHGVPDTAIDRMAQRWEPHSQ